MNLHSVACKAGSVIFIMLLLYIIPDNLPYENKEPGGEGLCPVKTPESLNSIFTIFGKLIESHRIV